MIIAITALLLALGAGPVRAGVPDDHVVARFTPTGADEVTITAGRLRRYADSHPGRAPRAALDDLIELELLAARARARGLAGAPEVRDATSAAAILRYLRAELEPAWRSSGIPEGVLNRAYQSKRGYFNRKEGRRVAHILVTEEAPAEDGKPAAKRKPVEPARAALAEAIAGQIRAETLADPPEDQAAFLARAERYRATAAKHGLTLVTEPLRTFSSAGGGFDPIFVAAAFAIEEEGGLSEVTETGFGFHVIRLDEIYPARSVTFEDAIPELRHGLLVPFRRDKLRALTSELARSYGAVVNERPLEQLEARRRIDEAPDGGAPSP